MLALQQLGTLQAMRPPTPASVQIPGSVSLPMHAVTAVNPSTAHAALDWEANQEQISRYLRHESAFLTFLADQGRVAIPARFQGRIKNSDEMDALLTTLQKQKSLDTAKINEQRNLTFWDHFMTAALGTAMMAMPQMMLHVFLEPGMMAGGLVATALSGISGAILGQGLAPVVANGTDSVKNPEPTFAINGAIAAMIMGGVLCFRPGGVDVFSAAQLAMGIVLSAISIFAGSSLISITKAPGISPAELIELEEWHDAFEKDGLTAENVNLFFSQKSEAEHFLRGQDPEVVRSTIVALQKNGFIRVRKNLEETAILRDRAASVLKESSSDHLRIISLAITQRIDTQNRELKSLLSLLEAPETHQDVANFEAILTALDSLQANTQNLSRELDDYERQRAFLEAVEKSVSSLSDEVMRLRGVCDSFCHYPFDDEDYVQARDLLQTALEDLEAKLREGGDILSRQRSEGSGVEDFVHWEKGNEAALKQSHSSEVKLESFIAAEKQKLRMRYEAVMDRGETFLLRSLPVGTVKKYLIETYPDLGIYSEYYDDEEAEAKLLAAPVVTVSVRDMLKLLGGFGSILGDELQRLADPRFGFTRASVVTKISADMATLAEKIAQSFMQDPAVLASDEFQAMGRRAQIHLIRQILKEIADTGDAEKLNLLFTNLEIFAAPMEKAFWLLDVPQYTDGEAGGTLLNDLNRLRSAENARIAAAASSFWTHYIEANKLNRR